MKLNALYDKLMEDKEVTFTNWSHCSSFMQWCIKVHGLMVSVTYFERLDMYEVSI